jgi:hypothetical protein
MNMDCRLWKSSLNIRVRSREDSVHRFILFYHLNKGL